jgi:ABC-type Na+ efflux pump permease subunit
LSGGITGTPSSTMPKTLTLSAASSILVGSYISTAGGAFTAARVNSIDSAGTTLTMNVVAASMTAGTVSYAAPTFAAF